MNRLVAWRRETLYLEADLLNNPWPDAFELRRFRLRSITTLKPSWSQARVGDFPDALQPVASETEPAQITAIYVRACVQPGVYRFNTVEDETLEINVLEQLLPEQRIFPFYSEVTSFDCLRAYASRGLTSEDLPLPYEKEGSLALHAIQLARSFGIEPVKQAQVAFHDPCSDLATVNQLMEGPYGYEQLVLKGAIAPPIIWCATIPRPESSYEPNQLFLQRINELAPAGSMAWCADEPSWNGIGHGMCVDEAIRRVLRVHKYAPNLIPMITTGATVLARLQEMVLERAGEMAAGHPIRFCIVQNEDDPSLLSHQKGSYFSCMAQGCSEDKRDGEVPKYPVAVVEGNPASDFQAAIKLADQNNAFFVLYYKITKRLQACWIPGGLYNEGGNGDGTAMYVDSSTGLAIPSIRMMHWHQAQQMVEKQMIETRALNI